MVIGSEMLKFDAQEGTPMDSTAMHPMSDAMQGAACSGHPHHASPRGDSQKRGAGELPALQGRAVR